jgi:hypothetical protein
MQGVWELVHRMQITTPHRGPHSCVCACAQFNLMLHPWLFEGDCIADTSDEMEGVVYT